MSRRGRRRLRDPAARQRPRRIRGLLAVALLALGLLLGRAAFLGTVKSGELSARAIGQQRESAEVPAPRGAIISRDGRDLAIDRPAVEVTGTPYLVRDATAAASRLAPALDVDPNAIANALSGESGFVVLARDVPPEAADRARELGIPGIDFRETYQRVLPRRRTAAQVLGLTDDERSGLTGLELQLDDALTGRPGRRAWARDPFGRTLRTFVNKEPAPGTSVRLTIDARIQERLEQVLIDTRGRFGAKAATAIVMRPVDGAVLAMATVPRYDPNRRASVRPVLERNRPVTDTFEPGSTFKLVTVAAAIEEGLVSPGTRLYVPEELTLYDRTLGEAHERAAQTMTVSQILEQSSNVGTVLIAEKLGARRLARWVDRLGFGTPTGIDFPGEVAGLVLPLEEWSGVSILNIPIGQGVGVTLTQLARAYAAVANGGRAVRPHLVARVGAEGQPVARGPRVMARRTARALDRMLREVVSPDGTGEAAKIPGYEVAGKTGTANKIDPTTGEYDRARVVTSFVGYAPADSPALVVAVAVDEPGGEYFGGDVAAPAFAEITEFSLQTLEIAP